MRPARSRLVAFAFASAFTLAVVVLARGAVVQPAAPTVEVVSSLETVRPGVPVHGARVATIAAARGEWESFQVVVHAGGGGLPAWTVRAEPLVGPKAARAIVRVHRVAFVDVERPSNQEGARGRWPDPLVPEVDAFASERRNAFPVPLAANEDGLAWIDVFTPRDAAPGVYRGAIAVEDGARVVSRVPVELTVHRFTLPATSSLPVTFGFYALSAQRAHFHRDATPDELLALTQRYALAALRDRLTIHGGTVDPAPFSRDASGAMRLDFTRYDAEVGPFLDGHADAGGPSDGARWTSFDLRVPYRLEGRDRADYLRATAAHLKDKGWLDRAFDYTCDEPTPARFDKCLERARSVQTNASGVARLVTHAPTPALDRAVDIWCPVVNLVDEKPAMPSLGAPVYAESFAARASKGERLWWYQSCLSHGCEGVGSPTERRWFSGWPDVVVDAPAVSQRVFEWLTFRERSRGISGELYYNTVEAYDGDPWRDAYRHGGNGDGTLFYPGRPDVIGGVTHIPIESIRLKRIRDGLEDYEYLHLLAKRDPAAADRIALRVAPSAWRFDHDGEHLLAARAEIARLLDAAERP